MDKSLVAAHVPQNFGMFRMQQKQFRLKKFSILIKKTVIEKATFA